LGSNPVAEHNARELVDRAREANPQPTVLIIGGGTPGPGETYLHAHPDLRLVACDVYGSPNVQFIADGHGLPLEDSSIDAVWIQAVLEHVLEPGVVVAEIRRVLKPSGLVYADTPFLQHVHEGAYDFTRFTESGHRWLFRDFARIDSGATQGPGTVLSWAIGAAATGLFRSSKLGLAVQVAFFWVRFIDLLTPRSHAIDTASAFYFLGRKTGERLGYKEAIREYRGALKS
jgi:SAM-dependent methyltransferase